MSQENEAIGLINQARSQARNDDFKRFFAKHSKNIITTIILFTVLLAGFFGYKTYKNSQEEKYSEILHQSLLYQQERNLEKAKENLKIIYESKSAPSGVKALASLRYAAFLLEEDNRQEAAKVYQAVNSCKSCDEYLHDLAGLLMVKLWMADLEEFKKEDLSLKIKKIEDGAKILKYNIAEQRAIFEMQNGNLEKAYEIFDLIAKSPEGSNSLKERAKNGLKMVLEKGFEVKKS